ncbi:MAG: UDP-N-acetylmuramate--L-alanine ligase [Deltaproteobacteria bacterium]|nr:UDP-N-acetylmuramate--L-alanine ligase [Deltaproteobacteria bacterium]
MYRKTRRIHFVGIGGIGMSGIAEVLLNLGHEISGSDQQESRQTRRLRELGASVALGHEARQAAGAEVVVVSSAVAEDNPEILEARRRLIPVIPRAEMLAELMRLKSSVAVAGSHGKTTTCSLVGTLLTHGGLDPTLVIGGRVNNLGLNARLGQGELLVAEADESDGSFLLLNPTWTVVTNVDREHMNYYRDLEHLKETFLAFVNRVPFYGASMLCVDDPQVRSLLPRVRKRHVTYGLSDQAEVTARDVRPLDWGWRFDLVVKGRRVVELTVNLPGRHNVQNALAAAAVGLELDLSPALLAEGIGSMKGVGRRFELKGQAGGVTVLDDYGHHPTEIRATLSALRDCYPGRRLVVLFQPHRHTRTKDLFDDFAAAFNQIDRLLVADIYGAGEKPCPGVDSRALADAVVRRGRLEVEHVGEAAAAAARTAAVLEDGDVLMTLGAGNVWQAGEEILGLLAAREAR